MARHFRGPGARLASEWPTNLPLVAAATVG